MQKKQKQQQPKYDMLLKFLEPYDHTFPPQPLHAFSGPGPLLRPSR